MSLRFTPFPILTTERLVLRKILPQDNLFIFPLRNNPQTLKYTQRVKMENMSEADEWIARINKGADEGRAINWAIVLKNTEEFAGLICLWNFNEDGTAAETGYELMPDFQGKGLMTEALDAVLEYGFKTLDLKMIEAFTHKDNAPSRRLLKRAGFVWNKNKIDEEFPPNVIYEASNNQL